MCKDMRHAVSAAVHVSASSPAPVPTRRHGRGCILIGFKAADPHSAHSAWTFILRRGSVEGGQAHGLERRSWTAPEPAVLTEKIGFILLILALVLAYVLVLLAFTIIRPENTAGPHLR